MSKAYNLLKYDQEDLSLILKVNHNICVTDFWFSSYGSVMNTMAHVSYWDQWLLYALTAQ